MLCKICGTRRPRRHCPGVEGDICALCCGTEREVTVSCPLDCVYLQEARLHEKSPVVDPATFPNPDVRITDEFLAKNEHLIVLLSVILVQASLARPETIDFDIREALESLTRTYRTLQSGLVYDSRPSNPVAAHLYVEIQKGIEEFRGRIRKRAAGGTISGAQLLGALVFIQRLEIQYNNGRRKGRAFLDFLGRSFPQKPAEPVVQI